jgi:kynurenine 3-monooxygenase
MNRRSHPRVLIVGAGLVGCVLAIYLARRGLAVRVYERNRDSRTDAPSRRPSLSLSLCTRGIRSLARVGLMERVGTLLTPAFGRMIHGPDGSADYQPYSAFGEAIHCVNRRELSVALLDAAEAAGVEVLFEWHCTSVDPASGAIAGEDRAGRETRDRAPAVFAADGCFSAVRRHLRQAGLCRVSERVADDGYKEFRVSAASAAAAGLRADVLHGWPRAGFIAGAFPERDGSFAGTLHMSRSGAIALDALQDRTSPAGFVERECGELVRLVPDLAEQLAGQQPTSIVSVTCRPWSVAGAVLLIGDAAHAMPPYYGQGANAGFQDCEILDDLVARHGADWPRVFGEFERLRAPDLDAMADLCHEHLTVLRERVSGLDYQAQWRFEQRVHQLVPDVFTPLYSMIAFSSMSYAEARRRHRLQDDVIRELLRDPDPERWFAAPMLRALFRRRGGRRRLSGMDESCVAEQHH